MEDSHNVDVQDIPKECIKVLQKYFPEIKNFSSTYLQSLIDSGKYSSHQKGLLGGAIYASKRKV